MPIAPPADAPAAPAPIAAPGGNERLISGDVGEPCGYWPAPRPAKPADVAVDGPRFKVCAPYALLSEVAAVDWGYWDISGDVDAAVAAVEATPPA